jgi:glycosyltransferase involved in cell wall biosynthesis
VAEDRAISIPNGVDTVLFQPTDREAARRALDLPADRPLILSVGRVSREKGYELVLDAMGRMGAQGGSAPILAIVGKRGVDAAYEAELLQRIADRGLGPRVLVPGPANQETLCKWFSAADVSCLASTREGWPNVILESIACGCPVVAANVGGVPEVIGTAAVGTVAERSESAFATALSDALTRAWDRAAIRRYAEARTWDATAQRCIEVLSANARAPT